MPLDHDWVQDVKQWYFDGAPSATAEAARSRADRPAYQATASSPSVPKRHVPLATPPAAPTER